MNESPLGEIAHWKAEYYKLKATQKTLRDRIDVLEREDDEKTRLVSASGPSINSRLKRGRDNADEVISSIEQTRKQVRVDGVERTIQRKEASVQHVIDVLDQHLPSHQGR